MDDMDILKREDELSNWRLVSLLAFNALLIPALEVKTESLLYGFEILIPIIGILITLSFLWVMYMSLKVKYKLHVSWKHKNGKPSPMGPKHSKIRFYFNQSLGPFLLSPIVLLSFWSFILLNNFCVQSFC